MIMSTLEYNTINTLDHSCLQIHKLHVTARKLQITRKIKQTFWFGWRDQTKADFLLQLFLCLCSILPPQFLTLGFSQQDSQLHWLFGVICIQNIVKTDVTCCSPVLITNLHTHAWCRITTMYKKAHKSNYTMVHKLNTWQDTFRCQQQTNLTVTHRKGVTTALFLYKFYTKLTIKTHNLSSNWPTASNLKSRHKVPLVYVDPYVLSIIAME